MSCATSLQQAATAIVTPAQNVEDYLHQGFAEVICLEGEALLAEGYAKQIAGLLSERGAKAFVTIADVAGRDLAARVAGYLDCPMVSDASELALTDGGITATRLAYGGAVVYEERISGFGVIGIASGLFAPAEPISEASPVTKVTAQGDARVSLMGTQPIEKGGVDLTKAERVVCAGMGFSTKEELKTAYDLAAALDAEVGCTRGLAENSHWFPGYIGLSGDQIKPKLYFSLGVSGQVQHTVGIRGAKLVFAVTKDPNAPILKNCDYGAVGDLFEITDALLSQIG
ncbi:MAG: electron transfer flavoprotein subunit alpha/FixB family protein [Coriobacteriales bacterium]|jgi:electron transfer flavoprotein alpha subunit|nr:electron transfer flavoprotein subunit alpha/FixB family protein [Coriobacteriales bacterium]